MKALFFMLSLLCGVVQAQDVVMFNEVAIGKPMTLSECPKGYEAQVHPLCYTDAGRSRLFLQFPQQEAPTYLGEVPPVLYVKDGVVVGMDIFTNGVIGQATAFQALVKKFGKPVYKNTEKVTTVAGAQHDSITAKWALRDVSVILNGTLSSVTEGVITIGTPGLNAIRAPKEKSREM